MTRRDEIAWQVIRSYVGCVCTGQDCECDADWSRWENDPLFHRAVSEEASQ